MTCECCGKTPKVITSFLTTVIYDYNTCDTCDREVCSDCYGDYDYATDTGITVTCKECYG